jgi:virginiamycin B lyase
MTDREWVARLLVVAAGLAVAIVPSAARAAPIASLDQLRLADGADPKQLARGSDGNVWFTESHIEVQSFEHHVGRITPAGDVTTFLVCVDCFPGDIVEGADNVLYFTMSDSAIGRIALDGTVLANVETPDPSFISLSIARSGDDLWLTDHNNRSVWSYDVTAGTFQQFPVPSGGTPIDVAAGPGGDIWFTQSLPMAIVRLAAGGVFTEFPIPSGNQPRQLTVAPDGRVWFTERFSNTVGVLDPSTGVVTEILLPEPRGPEDIVVDDLGNVWFTQNTGDNVGRLAPDGSYEESRRVRNAGPWGILLDHDGRSIWYAMLGNDRIGLLSPR